MTLTDLTQELVPIVGEERKRHLRASLAKINANLPATVYIPFVNSNSYPITFLIDSIRNYCVLHIVASEARVFQTKERAPLLLCIEAFRPEELSLIRDERRQQSRKKSQKKVTVPDVDVRDTIVTNHIGKSLSAKP